MASWAAWTRWDLATMNVIKLDRQNDSGTALTMVSLLCATMERLMVPQYNIKLRSPCGGYFVREPLLSKGCITIHNNLQCSYVFNDQLYFQIVDL